MVLALQKIIMVIAGVRSQKMPFEIVMVTLSWVFSRLCWRTISKTRAIDSSGHPSTENELKTCFEVFGYPDETRSKSFGNNFS